MSTEIRLEFQRDKNQKFHLKLYINWPLIY